MKTIILSLVAVLFAATSAMAVTDFGSVVAFNNMSAASGAVKTSSAYVVTGYKTKTLIVSGTTLASNNSSTVFKNMSGTLVAQCAPTSGGPWSTCTQGQSTGGAAVSATTNTNLTFSNAVAYIRLQWTAGTVGTKIKAWLGWTDN